MTNDFKRVTEKEKKITFNNQPRMRECAAQSHFAI